MKKASASRMKKLPILLGTLLIISVAAYGTRAYFSDSAKQQANIVLELGNVDISTDKTSDWDYEPLKDIKGLDNANYYNDRLIQETKVNDKKLDADNKEFTFRNVRPGDSFKRDYTIKNNGSLDAKIDVVLSNSNINIEDGVYSDDPFTVTVSGLDETSVLEAGEEEIYTVTITVKETIGDKFNAKNPNEIVADYLSRNVTVKAIQENSNNFAAIK